jgi:cephalosporin hydroxylase
MVILDSDHAMQHVLDELAIYGELVSPGNYLVIEDTNVNGHPVRPDFGPGPGEAVERFLADNEQFEVDTEREKFLMTFNPGGYLRRRLDQVSE